MTRWGSTLALTFSIAAGAVAGLTGCPDSGTRSCSGDFCGEDAPKLELQPETSTIEIQDAALAVGEPTTVTVRAINAGVGVLDLKTVRLEYTAPVGASETTPAFELVPLAVSLPFEINEFDGNLVPKGLDVAVKYTKPDDTLPRTALLKFTSNSIANPNQSITITTAVGVPTLTTSPTLVDFNLVPKSSEPVTKTLTLLNPGSRTLHVSGFRIGTDGRFGVKGAGFDISGPDGILGIDLTEAIAIPSGESTQIEVTFLSDSPAPATGELYIFSDDPVSGLNGHVVPLQANKSGPCIQVNPRIVDFGGKRVGNLAEINLSLTSCGTEPVSITGVALAPESSPDFGLDFRLMPEGWTDGISAQNPLMIPINTTVDVIVTFVADGVNPRDADNIPIPDEGTITVASNAFEQEIDVAVRGAGAEVECPTPVIRVEEGEEVIPQTVLHMDGTQSYAAFGRITQWTWSQSQDNPFRLVFVPGASSSQPVIEVNNTGVYTFRLDVTDENGNRSGSAECPTAEYTVLVQPDQAIHIELSWVTPGDDDEQDTGDGVGSDLDLHFAHEYATGPDLDGDGKGDPWFDEYWDCFWYNRNPKWGNLGDPADDPSLDRDDTDGGGPENLNLGLPEDNVTYQIGVHYWNDWDFGPADATVKVFHYADLIYEVTYDALEWKDMWCVGAIQWPRAEVVRCADDEDPEAITPNYVNTFFRPPIP